MKYHDQTLVISRTRRYKVQESVIQKICWTICSHLGVADFELAVQFVGLKKIRQLNRDFRGKDKPTDVLSFPQIQWPMPQPVKVSRASRKPTLGSHSAKKSPTLPVEPLGDLVISLDVAEKNARDIGHSLDREVCFLLVHGILHLCGHDHIKKSEEKLMLACQRKLMSILTKESPKKALWRGCVSLSHRNKI